MREHEFDIGYRILDDDLLDSNGRRCGKVDDIELEGKPGEPAYISAILAGPGAWEHRLPKLLRPLALKLFGRGVKKIPWAEVDDITAVVELKSTADELGLGQGDVQPWIESLPGA
jgi:hypothetical protein